MEVSSWITGRRGIALPFTDELAPLAPDAAAFGCLHREALVLAGQRHWKYFECRGGRDLFGDAPASESFLGHRLDLTAGESAIFSHFGKTNRGAIRQAGESGLKIEFSRDLEAIRAFHGLMCMTRRRHGVPPQPFSFFACVQRHVLAENQGWVVLARHNGLPVAGAVYFHFGKTVIYKYGASDEKFNLLRGNNLVMWEAIRRHAGEGFATLDFGRTALDNEGLRRFKLSWGTAERTIGYVRQELPSRRFRAARAPSAGWSTRIFRAVPGPILRLIGAVLYKHAA
jgi:hypothetical protein